MRLYLRRPCLRVSRTCWSQASPFQDDSPEFSVFAVLRSLYSCIRCSSETLTASRASYVCWICSVMVIRTMPALIAFLQPPCKWAVCHAGSLNFFSAVSLLFAAHLLSKCFLPLHCADHPECVTITGSLALCPSFFCFKQWFWDHILWLSMTRIP